MSRKPLLTLTTACALSLAGLVLMGELAPTPALADRAAAPSPAVARGKYLVTIMGCNDCHTPWKTTPRGPQPDMTRMLSGHPQDFAVTTPPVLGEGPWVWAATGTNTAFSGPWGVSFTANLTPDPETGLGKWTADTFIAALRTGRHEGQGRPILPPMPYPMIRQATDDDLRAIFGYLQSIPPVPNRVPQPIEPRDAS
jgi:hypothetical protein